MFLLVLSWAITAYLPLHATKFVVEVSNFQFNPSAIPNVMVGDTIRWEWISGSHTTTSTVIPNSAAAWDHLITSSSTFFEYKVTVAGNYDYKCTPHASMGMVGSFTASPVTGLTQVLSSPTIIVYPNPVLTSATVQYRSDNHPLSMIKIYDITGKLVYQRRIEDIRNDNDLIIDLSDFVTGLYFASFIDTENNPTIRRLIKQ